MKLFSLEFVAFDDEIDNSIFKIGCEELSVSSSSMGIYLWIYVFKFDYTFASRVPSGS